MFYFHLFCNQKGKTSLTIPKHLVSLTDANQVPQLWHGLVPGGSAQRHLHRFNLMDLSIVLKRYFV